MNLKAKCSNPKCAAFGIEKSVSTGQMIGYGAPNDRVRCPSCGELMTTTKSINVSGKMRGKTQRRKEYRKRGSKR
jgi:hypothetical protein